MMQSIQRVGRVVLLLALAGGLGSVLVGVAAVGAEGSRPFVATAEANGMYVRYGIPGFLIVDNYVDGGGPVAQATLGGDGVSASFASLPYPGPTASSYPLVVTLVTGMAAPGYPFSASASHPTQPEGAVADPSGTYSLKAAANDTKSSADARVSPGGEDKRPILRASSDVVPGDGDVTASAVSLAEGISVGPLSLGLVRSKSVTTYRQGDQEPKTETELVIEGGRAGDATFTFGRDGLEVAQQGVPLPADQGLATLNQALAPAGLSVRFQEATPLAGGAVAAAFEIVSVSDIPGAGKGILRLSLGGATSFVSLGATESAPEIVGSTEVPATESVGPASTAAASETSNLSPSPSAVEPATFPSSGDSAGYYGGASTASDVAAAPAEVGGAPPQQVVALPPTGLAGSPRNLGATSALAALLAGGGLLGACLIVAWGTRKGRRPWMV